MIREMFNIRRESLQKQIRDLHEDLSKTPEEIDREMKILDGLMEDLELEEQRYEEHS